MDGIDENRQLRAWAEERRAAWRPIASAGRPARASRDLVAALSGPGLAVVAQPARRSPEEGHLRQDLDVGEFACACARAGVAALALSTDPRFGIAFDEWGDLVGPQLALPVLFHDLVVSPAQVEDARRLGADAVWLHLGALDAAELRACVEAAHGLGMAVVAEGRTPEELGRGIVAGAEILCASAFDEMGAQNEDAALELLRGTPGEVLRLARGPVSGEAGLLPLRGVADGLWICGPASMPRDTFGYVAPLVAEARGISAG